MSHARFQKQARERARREKANAKRERREAQRAAAADGADGPPADAPAQHEVLADLADLHRVFEAGELDFVEFDRRKHESMAQLDV